jgi:hypothetical protein
MAAGTPVRKAADGAAAAGNPAGESGPDRDGFRR